MNNRTGLTKSVAQVAADLEATITQNELLMLSAEVKHGFTDTPRYAAISETLKEFTAQMLQKLPFRIEKADTSTEPFENVKQFVADAVKNQRIYTWKAHFHSPSPFMTDKENSEFRSVHDWFGHMVTHAETAGSAGDFNLIGEIQAIATQGIDAVALGYDYDKLVRLIEALIVETVTRNTVETGLKPNATPSSFYLALKIACSLINIRAGRVQTGGETKLMETVVEAFL